MERASKRQQSFSLPSLPLCSLLNSSAEFLNSALTTGGVGWKKPFPPPNCFGSWCLLEQQKSNPVWVHWPLINIFGFTGLMGLGESLCCESPRCLYLFLSFLPGVYCLLGYLECFSFDNSSLNLVENKGTWFIIQQIALA